MTKAKLIAGFYRATSPKHWLRLSWYFLAWFGWRLFRVKISGEQMLVFRNFRVAVDPQGLGGLVFLHEILVGRIYDVAALRPGSDIRVVFDAGANCGFFALFQSAQNPALTIYCFEPHPRTFQHLKRNIEANALTRVVPVHAAVGAASGTCQINVSAESSMAIVSSSTVQFLNAPQSVEVPLMGLDDFAARRNVWPDFIKIDVEGFEVEVLRGARSCLRHCRGIILEYHSEELKSQCVRLLEEAGFNIVPSGKSLLSGTKPPL